MFLDPGGSHEAWWRGRGRAGWRDMCATTRLGPLRLEYKIRHLSQWPRTSHRGVWHPYAPVHVQVRWPQGGGGVLQAARVRMAELEVESLLPYLHQFANARSKHPVQCPSYLAKMVHSIHYSPSPVWPGSCRVRWCWCCTFLCCQLSSQTRSHMPTISGGCVAVLQPLMVSGLFGAHWKPKGRV